MAGSKSGSADGISIRQWLPLVGLTLSAFIFNTSEFMPIGLLTDIGGTFGLDEAQTGIMISVYAWAVMVLSLPLMVAASRIEFKRLLLGVIAVFAAGQILSAVAPGYLVLVLARLVVASAHAVFWSIASIMATRLVSPRHGSLAISMIATGTAVAQIFGLPIGRAIGLLVGWRMTFACVGFIAIVVILYQGVVFPPMPAGKPFTLKQLPSLLKNPLLMGMYLVTFLFAGSYYTGYSYIEPFLAQIGGLDPNVITVALTVFGIAGMLGSVVFSRFFDGRKIPFIAVSILANAGALLFLRVAAAGLPLVILTFVAWGMGATVFNISIQAEVIDSTEADESAVAMSIFSGIFNLGIGCGTAFGGAVVNGLGIVSVGFAGGAVGLAAFVCAALLVLRPLARKQAR